MGKNNTIGSHTLVLEKDWKAESVSEYGFIFEGNKTKFVDGRNHLIDGANKIAHLIEIHDCSDLVVSNVRFTRGNTNTLKKIPRKNIRFAVRRRSIFEIIDGGAVVITGNSNVIFKNCAFYRNNSVMCGGAISNQSTGKVKVIDCVFEENSAGHTGSAIDNLVRRASIEIENCTFIRNKSNTWNNSGAPHGQISLFPHTSAHIIRSHFSGGSIPFDYHDGSTVTVVQNSYDGYNAWEEGNITHRRNSIFDKLHLLTHLYWIVPKTFGRVVYRVNV